MIKFEHTQVVGWEPAIRGMRNPMNSWEKSDSLFFDNSEGHLCHIGQNLDKHVTPNIIDLGDNDHDLMMRLAKAGSEHSKYRRMIIVYVDITAPLYWWKEFDTYKVGTVANSCSTMHKIHSKEFVPEDFSMDNWIGENGRLLEIYEYMLHELNFARDLYLQTKDKKYWKRMIELLSTSYNQKRTIMFNYEVLANIYKSRKNHKLDEWSVGFIDWIKSLPYSEIITLEENKENT